MDDLTTSRAMADEIEKIALGARTGNIIGGLLGAGTGATAGYLAAPEDQRVRAALIGGLAGGVAGAGMGQLGTGAGRKEVVQLGQRQLHGFTGYMPGRGVFGTQGPSLNAEARLAKLKEMGFHVPEAGTEVEHLERAREAVGQGMVSGKLPKALQEIWAKRRASQQFHQRRMMEAGGTSLPGLAKALAGESGLTPGQALKSNLLAQGLIGGVAVPVGLTIPSAVNAAQTGDTSQLKRDIGSTIGFGLGGVTPFTATMALGQAGSMAGGLVNRITG